ncbi:MAG: hypothetical protein JWP35_2251 [Caulobacter sp.]|nr:hypothetical protein [Caulobacter sp.]
MKRLLTAAVALSLFAGASAMATSASAQDHGRYDQQYDRHDRGDHRDHRGDNRGGNRYDNGQRYGNGYGNGYGNQGHRWARGQRYDYSYGRSYIDYRGHNLRRPPRGYGWVQDRNDFLLVALTSGLIYEIVANR